MLSTDLIRGADAAALYTGLPRRMIYNMVANGALPAIRKGRKLFFLKSALDRAFAPD